MLESILTDLRLKLPELFLEDESILKGAISQFVNDYISNNYTFTSKVSVKFKKIIRKHIKKPRQIKPIKPLPSMKVCTKCNKNMSIVNYTVIKNRVMAACKVCVYINYFRPSHLKRLRRNGRIPKAEKVLLTPEEKRQIRNVQVRKRYDRLKSERPPKIPKIKVVKPKPVKIVLSPEERKLRKVAYKKKYRQDNPDKFAAERRRYNLKKKNCPQSKAAKNIRKRLKEFIGSGTKIGAFSQMVGCTKEELMNHIESQFEPGMSWDNYGQTTWNIDHVRPMASFDLTNPVTWKEANHYSNLKPMWADQNSKKSSHWNGVKYAKGKPVEGM